MRDVIGQAVHGHPGYFLPRDLVGAVVACDDHVGFEQCSRDVDALLSAGGKGRIECLGCDVVAALRVMRAIHQDLWFDDWDQSLFLTDCRVASQCVRVRRNAGSTRHPFCDTDDSSPLCEARAQREVLCAALPEPVESLCNLLTRVMGEALGPGVDLDSWMDAPRTQFI